MTNEVATLNEEQALQKEEARVGLAFGLPPNSDGRRKLARVTYAYHLDPFLSHVILMGDKPYITHAGLLYHTQRDSSLRGISCEPLTPGQRQALGAEIQDGELWRFATVRREIAGHICEFSAYGRAGGKGESNPIAKGQHGYAMADKRAINRALRLAYSVHVPSREEMDAEDESPVQLVGCSISGCTAAISPEAARLSSKLHGSALCPEHTPGRAAPAQPPAQPEKPRRGRPPKAEVSPPAPVSPPPPDAVIQGEARHVEGEGDVQVDGATAEDGGQDEPDDFCEALYGAMNELQKVDKVRAMSFFRGPLGGRKVNSLKQSEASDLLALLRGGQW